MDDLAYMQLALAEARAAAEKGEVPVGCVVALGDRILARAGNSTISACDPSAHAEIVALRAAANGHRELPSTWRHALRHGRAVRDVRRSDDSGANCARRLRVRRSQGRRRAFLLCRSSSHPALNHRVEVLGGVLAEECAGAMQTFFAAAPIARSAGAIAESLPASLKFPVWRGV